MTETRRIKLIVAYDGSDFRGWAAQPDQRTVQSTLKEAVDRIADQSIEIFGASRTDSGAHAQGQVIHFDSPDSIPVESWRTALNRRLPEDVRILNAEMVDETFHCRFCAEYRTYHYRILKDADDPFVNRFGYSFPKPLNLESMKSSARKFVGKHNFKAFTEELEPSVQNTIRELYRIEVIETENAFTIQVDGTAFLRGMMRRIAGFILEAGRGHRPTEDATALLEDENSELQWPVVLPAKGLHLMNIHYACPPVDCRTKGYKPPEDF